MREIGPFVPVEGDDGPGHSLFWSVEGRGREAAPSTCASPRARTSSGDCACTPTSSARTSVPARWSDGTSVPPTCTSASSWCASRCSARTVRTRCGPGLDRLGIGYGGLLNLTGYPDRPPVRPGRHGERLPHRRVRRAGRAGRALPPRRRTTPAQGAVVDACLYGAVLRILEWTIAGYDRLGIVREREGNRLANSAPLDNYPTADGKYVCIVAGQRRQLPSAVQGDGPTRSGRRPALHAAGRPSRER